MKLKSNIYIKALEIGYSAGDTGVSLKKMLQNLCDLKYEFSDDLFKEWFYRNFEHKLRQRLLNNPSNDVSVIEDNKNLILSSESLFQYLEYVELKEARKNSKSAKTQSFIAIGIAIISLFATIFITAIDKTQKVSVEYLPEHIEKSIEQYMKNQLETNKLLIEIKSKQDSVINTMKYKPEIKK
jgi:hypothetical protein